jgi:hypothetical protein
MFPVRYEHHLHITKVELSSEQVEAYMIKMLRNTHCLDNRLVTRLSASRTGRVPLPRNVFMLLVLISVILVGSVNHRT